ncbi:hypothetical protein CP967_31140 [Streptomyces nitrosporeus]|uniref:Minor tail protein n=1 Tax=Streptomyces nitrosporeus TaxID=28894 RepID=A0A5J6FJP1_9ACTN|nr:hypothetical protein CP967_31140 [Streptomyces nitrosporeus]
MTDVISLGPPQTPSGNLLPYNTASVEVSTAAWSAYTNAVVSRSSEAAWEGWHSLVATSVAAGPMDIGQAPLVSVTPGVEYVASAVVRPDVASTVRVDLRWYDASSALMSQSDTPWSAPAGTWTTCTTIGIAPPGAAFARLVLHPVATDVGQRWLFDRMALRPAPTPVGSLIGYNIASMEVDASGWSAIAGCTVERSTDRWWEGSASLKITADGTTDAWVGTTAVIPVTPRVSYSATPMVWAAASTATRIFVTRLTWQNSAGEDIRISDFRWRIVAGASGWFVLPSSGAAPDAASSVRVSVAFEAPTAGDVYHIDAVDVVPGGVSAIADPLPDQYGARITLSGLTTDAHTYWGLWRADATGDRTPVRGSTGDTSQMLITGDSTIVEDFEAPLGVPTTYVLALWTPAGSSRRTTSDAIVIPEPAPSEVVLKDPGLPARQTTAAVSKGGQPQWTRRARQGVNAVRGRSRPIVISDVRTSREGTMTLVTETTEDLASMWWLLETGNVLLIQWPSLWGERDVYVSVGDVTEAPIVGYAEYRDRTWTVPLTEVDRPIGGATGAADRTWQAVATDHTSWTDVSTTYRSWLGVYTGVEGT